MPQSVSAIVVTWNGAEILRDCLDSLLAQQAVGMSLEVIVVDNGSEDNTPELLAREYPGVVVVALPTNLGFTGGANAGIRASTSDLVVLVNNDARADPGFIAALQSRMSDDERIGAVTGLILLSGLYEAAVREEAGALLGIDGGAWHHSARGEQLVNSTGGEVTTSANGRDRDWLLPIGELARESGPVPAFSGGAVALRRAALDDVGLFDERLFMYYEDTDLSWRMRAAGWRVVFEPDARVAHLHAASSGATSEFFLFHNERNRLLFAVKHGTAPVLIRAFGRTVASLVRSMLERDGDAVRRKRRAIRSALGLAMAFWRERRGSVPARGIRRELWKGAPAD